MYNIKEAADAQLKSTGLNLQGVKIHDLTQSAVFGDIPISLEIEFTGSARNDILSALHGIDFEKFTLVNEGGRQSGRNTKTGIIIERRYVVKFKPGMVPDVPENEIMPTPTIMPVEKEEELTPMDIGISFGEPKKPEGKKGKKNKKEEV